MSSLAVPATTVKTEDAGSVTMLPAAYVAVTVNVVPANRADCETESLTPLLKLVAVTVAFHASEDNTTDPEKFVTVFPAESWAVTRMDMLVPAV